jgi:cysteine desulfurase/selenocysteine lyase
MNADLTAAALRARFPILGEALYVNHAAVSPWPRDSVEAVRAYTEDLHRHGPLHYRRWLKSATELRQSAADLMHAASPDEISLLQNTSDGVNTLTNGLDWRAGDNVVTLQDDFPSNALPWHALARLDVQVRAVNARHAPDPEAALLDQVDDRTRVIAVSSVDWTDGFRLDLSRIGAACRAAGVILFVDAIQQLGALALDVVEQQIDVLAAGTHKWLLGPEGMGLFYCRAELRGRLWPARQGWHMMADRFNFTGTGRLPAGDGRRFEAGTPNRAGQVALLASLQMLHAYGEKTIERRILANTERLMSGLPRIPGLEVISATETRRRSGIVTFGSNLLDMDRLAHTLARTGIHGVRRAGGIRLSPHFYQGSEEIDRVLNGIEAAVKLART